MGLGDALVESMPFDRRVTGSNPALAATLGPWASPSLAVACRASACKLRHIVNCWGRERFWKAHAVRSAIEMDKYNTIQYNTIQYNTIQPLGAYHCCDSVHRKLSLESWLLGRRRLLQPKDRDEGRKRWQSEWNYSPLPPRSCSDCQRLKQQDSSDGSIPISGAHGDATNLYSSDCLRM